MTAAPVAPMQPAKPAAVTYSPESLAALPDELTARACWVAFRHEWRDGNAGRAGKWTKTPYRVRATRQRASSTDAATWAPFDEAVRALAADPTLDGLGFVFAPDAGLVGVDLDHCRDAETGAMEPWAQAILDELATYAEVSPSGTGVHLIAAGTLPAGGNRRGRAEMYAAGRFFTVTARHIAGTPPDVRPADAALRSVHAAHVVPAAAPAAPTLALMPRADAASGATAPTPSDSALTREDLALLAEAFGARNSEKVRALYAGNANAYGDDASRADSALITCLAHYTQDARQLDRLFRSSKLYRPKWDAQHGLQTYGARTIARALEFRAQLATATADPATAAAGDRDAPATADAPHPSPALPRAIRLLDADDEPPPVWQITNMIPAREPVLFAGAGGSMKTTIALHIAVATAAGGCVFGQHPVEAAPVLIVSGEDPLGVLQNRIRAIAKGHGWAWERVAANLHIIALADTDLAGNAWRAHLLAEVERTGARLVILDPLTDLIACEENSASDMAPVMATWRALAKAGATPILVHHAGKKVEGKSLIDMIRGSSKIPNTSRCTFFAEATDAGVLLHNLKQSRGAKLPPFVVTAEISTAPENSAVWTSARFTRTTVRKAERSAAAVQLLELITEQAGRSGSELQKLAGVSRRALTDALGELEREGQIYAVDGPRGAKLWHLSDLSDLSAPVPDTSEHLASDLSDLSPYGGTDRSDRSDALEGAAAVPVLEFAPIDADGPNGPWLDEQVDDDAAYLADERAALEDRAA